MKFTYLTKKRKENLIKEVYTFSPKKKMKKIVRRIIKIRWLMGCVLKYILIYRVDKGVYKIESISIK